MGKKKVITRFGQPTTNNIPSPQQSTFTSPNDPLLADQQSLMVMLNHTTHTIRISALNSITNLIKSHNVSFITAGAMFNRILELMQDRMMDVGLAATALMRHVVQICDQSMLNTLVGYQLPQLCYTLLEYLEPCSQSFQTQKIITKGHGLYWYNPSYLNMVRMITHVVKILSALFEANDTTTNEFMTRITNADQFLTAPTEQQIQQFQQQEQLAAAASKPLPPQPVNYLNFFLQLLSINIGSIPPHLIPTIHLPFITQLQLDLLHCLRVLCHENLPVTLFYLSNPTMVQYLLQEPLNLLTQQQQTTATTSYSPQPPPQTSQDQPIQPSTIINASSDSIYTYQYCQSIVLSNLYIEYQKVVTQSNKQSALGTSFTIHSLPHTNIELAMTIAVIIATMFEQINSQTGEFITNEQQGNTMKGLYSAMLNAIGFAIEKIDINQELAIYTQSLQTMRHTLVTIAGGDLSILEQYNLHTAMGETNNAVQSQQTTEDFKKQSRQQFKTLNINNRIDPYQQQQMLIQSLQHVATIRDGNQTNQELDSVSDQNSNDLIIDEPTQTVANNDHEAFSSDEFPLQQLWNDAVGIHNTVITQYFNVKTLINDCLTMLLSNHIEEDDDDDEDIEGSLIKSLQQQQQGQQQSPSTPSPTHSNQLQLLHQAVPQLLQLATLTGLLNHSYSHIHQAQHLFNTPSYYPSSLVFNIHTLYNANPEDYANYISFLAYQSTLMRVGSIQNVLFLLQYTQKYKPTTIFLDNAQTFHNIILTIIASTSLARIPQSQQSQLSTLQDHYIALSSIEMSSEISNPQRGLEKIASILNQTSIDEANLILQTLASFVSDENLCKVNNELWNNQSMAALKQVVAPIKEKIHVTETFTQATIDQIYTSLPSQTQQQHLFVSESLASSLQNFIGYFVTAQYAYQASTAAFATIADGKKYAAASPQVEFQTTAMSYISTMAINYPLFGPLMPSITANFVTLMGLFAVLKVTQFNGNLLFQFINLIIDIFSEDDRLVMAYTANRITQSFNSLAKLHTEYLTSLKQAKLALKPKTLSKLAAKRNPKAAAQTVSLPPQKQQQLIELQEMLEITTEANLNLVGFIEYKRKMKL